MIVNQSDIPDFENDLLAYINKHAEAVAERPVGYGITKSEFAQSQNPPLAFTTAARMLNKLVEEKKLQTKHMKQNGHIVTVYFK